MRNLVIVGKGGFAKEVNWLIDRINQKSQTWIFLGFIDNKWGNCVIGDDMFLQRYDKALDVVIAIGNPAARKRLFDLYKGNENLNFPNIIDPSVMSSDKVHFGIGNIICASTILTVDIEIGDFNIMNLGCTVGHGTVIHDFVTINPGVNISGDVYIESFVNIGTGTQIVQGKRIGHNTIVGAGAVINKSLPELCTAVGVPAKPIKYHGKD